MIRVSAIIAVYNRAATIGRAIQSVMAQQFDGFEVIVVDDGSTDSTPAALEEWGAQIRVIRQPNRGPAAARNSGDRNARGEYLAFLDSDDEWMPAKLGRMVTALDRAPNAVLAFSRFTSVDESGRDAPGAFLPGDNDHAPSMEEMLNRFCWPILTSAVVMRRETFARCGGFNEEFRFPGYEDLHLWLLAREQGEFLYIPEALTLYRSEPELERVEKYVKCFATFRRLVRARYGHKGEKLIAEILRYKVGLLDHEGLIKMLRGDRKGARRAFVIALRYDPWHLRTATRLLRTFLPLSIARALTGRTRLQIR